MKSQLNFWNGNHPQFGVWHHPHATLRHSSDCFTADYGTNSIGARDVERTRESTRPRVIVLGDSIVEGWGLAADERFSNLLEKATGLEHLNFGMSHFSPYQSYIAYRELAKQYSHDAVFVTIVSLNDFDDLDFSRARGAYHYSYRPYLVPDKGTYRHLDHREAPIQRVLRRNSRAYGAAVRLVTPWLSGSGPARKRGYSGFYDFTEGEFALLEHSLELLAEEATQKKLVVLLVPLMRDMGRYHLDGDDPLSKRLVDFEERTGARVINLLPVMYRNAIEDKARYRFECDFHWNALANQAAARAIRENLEGSVYPVRERPHPASGR